MPESTLPPAASIRAVRPMRSASGLTCGLVTTSSGTAARAALEQAGDLLHLDQAQLRSREHDEIDAVDVAP